MKILHLTHTYIETDSRILKEISCLAEAGHEVYGIGAGRSLGKKTKLRVDAKLQSIEIKMRNVDLLPKYMKRIFIFFEMFWRMVLASTKLRPEVIHCHDIIALIFGATTSLFVETKLIYDAHELESRMNGQTKLMSRFVLLAEKVIGRRIASVIVVSPSIQSWYRETLGWTNTSVILNSPLYPDAGIFKNSYLRDHFSIEEKKKIFLYSGMLREGRGLDLIVDIFNMPTIESHVVFMGDGDQLGKLKIIAETSDRIHFHDLVPHEEVVEVTRSADFGLCLIEKVSLSDYYCLPNKLFEYAFARVPVVASNFPDIRKVVEDHSLGVVCDFNAHSIFKTIRSLETGHLPFDFRGLSALSWDRQKYTLLALYGNL